MASADYLIEAVDLRRSFALPHRLGQPRRYLHAVRGVDLRLRAGETLALVGESGSGKSTIVRMLLGLTAPTGGDIVVDGRNLANLGRRELAHLVQPVFQDPYLSLNPSKRIADIVALPLTVTTRMSRADRRREALRMMDLVGLPASFADRSPRQLSGGQRQRVAIARALVSGPKALICDEPTSALDVSVQAQILNLLQDLRQELGLSYLLVTHNLALVETLADRIAVMYFGRIVETGPASDVLSRPAHPYTKLLADSALVPDLGRRLPEVTVEAISPDPHEPITGCSFRARCDRASSICATHDPTLAASVAAGAACHHPLPPVGGDPQRTSGAVLSFEPARLERSSVARM